MPNTLHTLPFVCALRSFKVEPRSLELFQSEWLSREAAMSSFPGFQGFKLSQEGEQWVAQSQWASIPEWEAWNLSPVCRRSHLPLVGVAHGRGRDAGGGGGGGGGKGGGGGGGGQQTLGEIAA